jgi:hypothetical protein
MARNLNKVIEVSMREFSSCDTPIGFDKFDLSDAVVDLSQWANEPRKLSGVGTKRWRDQYGTSFSKLPKFFALEHIEIILIALRDAEEEE